MRYEKFIRYCYADQLDETVLLPTVARLLELFCDAFPSSIAAFIDDGNWSRDHSILTKTIHGNANWWAVTRIWSDQGHAIASMPSISLIEQVVDINVLREFVRRDVFLYESTDEGFQLRLSVVGHESLIVLMIPSMARGVVERLPACVQCSPQLVEYSTKVVDVHSVCGQWPWRQSPA